MIAGKISMKYKIKVLYIVSDLLKGMGGIQNFVMSVYNNINRNNIQIDFVIHVDKGNSFVSYIESFGSKVYMAPKVKEEGIFKYVLWWNNFFKQHQEYKIVHGHMKAYMSIYLFIAKIHKRITIAHSHSVCPKIYLSKLIMEKIMLFPLRYIANYCFACSLEAGKYLFGKNIVKKSKFFFVPNANNVKAFVYDVNKRNFIRKQLNLSNQFVLGDVGRFHKNKNYSFLLKIFAEVYKKEHSSRLLLLGDGPLKDQLIEEAKKLGIEKYVVFQGIVSNPEDYYQAMDIFVFPSLYEGLGMVLTEAQISGLQCVFSANLPKEVDLEVGLCHRISLEQTANIWAEEILKYKKAHRISHDKEAKNKGFDIVELAKKLENFYMNVGE